MDHALFRSPEEGQEEEWEEIVYPEEMQKKEQVPLEDLQKELNENDYFYLRGRGEVDEIEVETFFFPKQGFARVSKALNQRERQRERTSRFLFQILGYKFKPIINHRSVKFEEVEQLKC